MIIYNVNGDFVRTILESLLVFRSSTIVANKNLD